MAPVRQFHAFDVSFTHGITCFKQHWSLKNNDNLTHHKYGSIIKQCVRPSTCRNILKKKN